MSDLGWKYLTPTDKDAILRGIRDGVAYGGPFHVEIHPADRCNIDCFFCSTATLRGTDEFPMGRFEELLSELKTAGTRSIRLSGGGEPLFHRKTKDFLRAIVASGIPIENITTNAVLLDDQVASILTGGGCDQVTISLNTGDGESYAKMMQTPARNFDRVLRNVRGLSEKKKEVGSKRPLINIQYLVWKENFRTIPAMYRLAREIGADTIFFNGLAFLEPHQKMNDEEVAGMMSLYEEVIRVDEYRTVTVINSFERDISGLVEEMNGRLGRERSSKPALRRLADLLMRRDFSLREKLAHRKKVAAIREVSRALEGKEEYCAIGWHSMVVRVNGSVAPCCILQGSVLGNVYEQSLEDVWQGEPYQTFRRELAEIMREGDEWAPDSARHRTVGGMCGNKGSDRCPIRTFYYRSDVAFVEELNAMLPEMRG